MFFSPNIFFPVMLLQPLPSTKWCRISSIHSTPKRIRAARHSALPSAPPVPFGAARQRLRDATGASELTAPLPWPPETAEVGWVEADGDGSKLN